MTKTITGTLTASLLRPSRKYRGRSMTHKLDMWEVWALDPEGRTFLCHVEGTSHAHAMIKARVRLPQETRNILLQKEYLP